MSSLLLQMAIVAALLITTCFGACGDIDRCDECLEQGGGCLWCYNPDTKMTQVSRTGSCALACEDASEPSHFRYDGSCPKYVDEWYGMERTLAEFIVIWLPIIIIFFIIVGVCCFAHHWKLNKAKKEAANEAQEKAVMRRALQMARYQAATAGGAV